MRKKNAANNSYSWFPDSQTMKKIFSGVFNQKASPRTSTAATSSAASAADQNLTAHASSGSHNRREKQSHIIGDIATPTLSQSNAIQHERAMLVEASSPAFGHECLRLINIIFQTSQTFPSVMGTCGSISQHLRKELFKKYPGERFHIVIGQNNAFGFAIDDGDYFAEMEQEQYRVLIFTTRREGRVSLDRHDADSQMLLEWKSLVSKPSKNKE